MHTEIIPKGTGEHIVFFGIKTIDYIKETDSFLREVKMFSCDKEDYDKYFNQYYWTVDRNGYLRTSKGSGVKKKTILFHRLVTQASAEDEIDHKNGDCSKNEKSNLRNCGIDNGNWFNKQKYDKYSSSKFKGVYWHKTNKVWCAQIRYERRKYFLGCHNTQEAAAKAYDTKAREIFKEFGTYNFPLEGERSAI